MMPGGCGGSGDGLGPEVVSRLSTGGDGVPTSHALKSIPERIDFSGTGTGRCYLSTLDASAVRRHEFTDSYQPSAYRL